MKLAVLMLAFVAAGCLMVQMPGSSGPPGSQGSSGSPFSFFSPFTHNPQTDPTLPKWAQGPAPDIHKAVYSTDGATMLLRSDDDAPWRHVRVTLLTDSGYYKQQTADISPAEVRALTLAGFTNGSGEKYQQSIHLKSVWIDGKYSEDSPVHELAYPAETFGFTAPSQSSEAPPRSTQPPTQNTEPSEQDIE